MGLAVVASQECAGAVDAVPERDFLTAGTVEAYVRQIESLLQNPDYAKVMGKAARDRVVARYSWEAHLSGIDRYLDDPGKLI